MSAHVGNMSCGLLRDSIVRQTPAERDQFAAVLRELVLLDLDRMDRGEGESKFTTFVAARAAQMAVETLKRKNA